MHSAHSSKTKKYSSRLLLVLFGFLLGAIVAEAALRLIGYSYPEFYMVDELRGYALRPGMEGWYRKEGDVYVRINSDGLRDREHSKKKPANTFRIALLGDSYPEAFPVQLEQAFWMVMENKLQGCPAFANQRVEVINFGVSGYGTALELLTLRAHVWDYAPDLVMLAVTTNNDITDNSRALKKTDRVPYFVYRDGQLVLNDSFRNTRNFRLQNSTIGRAGSWVYDRARLAQAVSQGYQAFKIYKTSRRARPQASVLHSHLDTTPKEVAPLSEELGLDNAIYHEPRDAVWNDAWSVTEALIVQMGAEVRAKDAKFLVVTLSNGPQVLPPPAHRQMFMQRVGINELFYPDNRIKTLCERERISLITLAPELQAYAEKNYVYLHGFGSDIGNGHWNKTGHQVAGEMLAQKICRGEFTE